MTAFQFADIMDLEVLLLVMLTIFSHTGGERYELMVLDEEVFISCRDPDPRTLDVNGLFDLSNFLTSLDADGITVSGNATLKWDIQQTDRVQVINSPPVHLIMEFYTIADVSFIFPR